jgi:hypothetical protein
MLSGRQDLRHGDYGERRDGRSPDTLHDAAEDQHGEARGEGADHTPHRKTREADGEDAPHPEEVRDPPVERDAYGVGKSVSRNHPTHLGRRSPELRPDERDEDVDHGRGEHRDEDRRSRDRQKQPGGDRPIVPSAHRRAPIDSAASDSEESVSPNIGSG